MPSPFGRHARLSALSLAVVGAAILPAHGTAQSLDDLPDGFFAGADFRHVGPVGNRVSAVVGEPGDPNVYYIGAASGGVFKSEDGGHSWRPIFDYQPSQSIGALAVAPSDANVVWAGTGEAFIRSNVSIGNGVYRSTDGGENWTHMGLAESGRIGRIAIHPNDPDIVFVAAVGHLWAKIASLAGYSSGSDDPPTDQMLEVRDVYRAQLAEYLRRWAELAAADVAQFNRMLVEQGLPPIISE